MHEERVIRIIALLAALGVLARAPAALSWLAGAFSELPLISALQVAWLAAPLAAVAGVFRRRSWGIWCLYATLVLGLVFGSTLIPFWNHIPQMHIQAAGYIVLNLGALALVARAHVRLRAGDKWAAA